MPQDLTVLQGTNVVLDDTPPVQYVKALQRLQITKLNDLVDMGVVKSRDTLDKLLHSARDVTALTIGLRETYVPFVPIPGTRQPDLRRYGAYRAKVPEVNVAEADVFWRVVRDISPTAIAHVGLDSDLTIARINPNQLELLKYLFHDVEVQPNSTLTLFPNVHVLECHNLIIRQTGKIVVKGSGIVIKAFSIQGNM